MSRSVLSESYIQVWVFADNGYCNRAASLASGCKVKINTFYSGYDLRQNTALGTFLMSRSVSDKWLIFDRSGDELSNIVNNRYGFIDYEYGIAGASTDFVSTNVTYAYFRSGNERFLVCITGTCNIWYTQPPLFPLRMCLYNILQICRHFTRDSVSTLLFLPAWLNFSSQQFQPSKTAETTPEHLRKPHGPLKPMKHAWMLAKPLPELASEYWQTKTLSRRWVYMYGSYI